MSLETLNEHRRVWRDKPMLEQIYRNWFELLVSEIPRRGRALEIGSGPGLFGEYVRKHGDDIRLVTSDVVPTPWNDLACDGERIPFRDGTLQAIVAFDLVHHLARPERLFAEAHRVLVAGGVLAVVEPWVTPLSFPIYRWLHREGCGNPADPWEPFPGNGNKQPFDGDAGVFTHLIRRTSETRWRHLGFTPPRVRVLSGFAYLLSLGFQPRSLLPRPLAPLLLALDRRLTRLARIVGLRALVVWRRLPEG